MITILVSISDTSLESLAFSFCRGVQFISEFMVAFSYFKVINKKIWREIIKGLSLPASVTSAAFTLRTQ